MVCSCSCEFVMLCFGSCAVGHPLLMRFCLSVCLWVVGGRSRLRLRLARERVVMRRRRWPPSGVTAHDHLMCRCIVTTEPVGRERHGFAGCAVRLSGVTDIAVPRCVVATELVSRERPRPKLVGNTKGRRTEDVLGSWTGFCRSVEQRFIPLGAKRSIRSTPCSESACGLCAVGARPVHARRPE